MRGDYTFVYITSRYQAILAITIANLDSIKTQIYAFLYFISFKGIKYNTYRLIFSIHHVNFRYFRYFRYIHVCIQAYFFAPHPS